MSIIAISAEGMRLIDPAIVRENLQRVEKNGHTIVVLYPFKDCHVTSRLDELMELHKWLRGNNFSYDCLDQEPEWDEVLTL